MGEEVVLYGIELVQKKVRFNQVFTLQDAQKIARDLGPDAKLVKYVQVGVDKDGIVNYAPEKEE